METSAVLAEAIGAAGALTEPPVNPLVGPDVPLGDTGEKLGLIPPDVDDDGAPRLRAIARLETDARLKRTKYTPFSAGGVWVIGLGGGGGSEIPVSTACVKSNAMPCDTAVMNPLLSAPFVAPTSFTDKPASSSCCVPTLGFPSGWTPLSSIVTGCPSTLAPWTVVDDVPTASPSTVKCPTPPARPEMHVGDRRDGVDRHQPADQPHAVQSRLGVRDRGGTVEEVGGGRLDGADAEQRRVDRLTAVRARDRGEKVGRQRKSGLLPTRQRREPHAAHRRIGRRRAVVTEVCVGGATLTVEWPRRRSEVDGAGGGWVFVEPVGGDTEGPLRREARVEDRLELGEERFEVVGELTLVVDDHRARVRGTLGGAVTGVGDRCLGGWPVGGTHRRRAGHELHVERVLDRREPALLVGDVVDAHRVGRGAEDLRARGWRLGARAAGSQGRDDRDPGRAKA